LLIFCNTWFFEKAGAKHLLYSQTDMVFTQKHDPSTPLRVTVNVIYEKACHLSEAEA